MIGCMDGCVGWMDGMDGWDRWVYGEMIVESLYLFYRTVCGTF